MFAGLKKNPLVYLTGRVWEYSRGNRKSVVAYAAMFLMANAASLALPAIVAFIFNTIQRDGVTVATLPYIWWLLSVLLVREVVAWAFHGPARVMENENAFRVRVLYKQYLVDGVLGLPVEWHTNHHTGDTIDKVEKGSTRLSDYTESTFLVIQMLAGLVGACLALAYFAGKASVVPMVMIVLTLAMVMKFDQVLVKQYQQLSRFDNRTSEKVVDIITNITTVVILRIQKPLSKSLATRMEEPFELYRKNIRINEVKWFLVSMNTRIMSVLTIGLYLHEQVHAGLPILIGTVYALYGYAENISGRFSNFASLYSDVLRQRASVANAEELSVAFPADRSARNAEGLSEWKELAIRSLTFSYHPEEGADVHLDGVNLSVKRGERIAFIGETGSGKSTLLKVIRELYHPQSVQVFLDGRLLPDGFATISPEITLVPQEPEIFATTIMDNITMGVEYDQALVRRYTDMARFTAVAERLPNGFASSVREKGVNLSGGEKQRLALARGLLACHDKSLVLLDEPTSSIDITNELAIYRSIFDAFRDKTVISSVHHLHLLPLFDRIYLFDNGSINASGTLARMLEHSPAFRSMWNRYQQTGGLDDLPTATI